MGYVYIACDCKYHAKGVLRAYDDKYDFELHSYNDWLDVVTESVRNAETLVARLYHGAGQGYKIEIRGEKYIDQRGNS